ncbi:MAG: 4-alpha-glucanotransferase, partial [Myxococcota bacterium]|nr:4-alpha-glucanotransferase [Myxococcota bacterium]
MLKTVREKPACLDERRGGLLLPMASLPWGHGIGDIGSAARRFVDWVASCGLGLWQILPCTPLSYGWSPYSGSSAFAVEPLLVDLHDLVTLDLLRPAELPAEVVAEPRIDYKWVMAVKKPLLERAASRLASSEESFWRSELSNFRKRQGDWLEDAALFFSLHERHGNRPFWEWESALAGRQPRALRDARRERKGEIATQAALQLLADRQCQALRAHALTRGVALIGDMPLYVARDSADCWARPELFALASPG